jgi:membrane protease YdiL (CAAX protease family)
LFADTLCEIVLSDFLKIQIETVMTNRPFKWIAQHQVTGFLILTFGFSWFFFWLSFVVFVENRLAQGLCGKIAAFGPALVAMLVSAIANPRPKSYQTRARLMIFGAVWLVSWAVLLAYLSLVLQIPMRTAVIIVFGVVALLPAWVVSASRSSTPGVRAQFSTLWKPHGPFRWYVVALISYPIVLLLGALIATLNGENIAFRNLTIGNAVLLPFLMFADGYFTSGGVNEESGWRGFLLPRLQRKQSILVASITVWLFWALWHLPVDVGQRIPIQQVLLNRIVFNLLASVLFAWVYNRTGGSIVAPAIFHSSMNTAGAFLPVSLTFLVPLLILVVFALVHDRMWRHLPQDHPAAPKALTMNADTDHSTGDVM